MLKKSGLVGLGLAVLVAPLFSLASQSCVDLKRTIALGSSGSDVVALQTFLRDNAGYTGKIAGTVGNLTVEAIKRWQTAHGVEAVGSIGPRTRLAMACKKVTTANAPNPLVSNQTKIADLQAQLKKLMDLLASLKGQVAPLGGDGATGPSGGGGATPAPPPVSQPGPAPTPSPASCMCDGTSVAHGASVTACQASFIPAGVQCISQTRTCTNGTLSGTYQHATCSPPAAESCNISDLASLRFCFSGVTKYKSFNFTNDISCSDGSCCGGKNHEGLMSLVNTTEATIYGNGHIISRLTNQRECPVLLIKSSTSTKVVNISFDEDVIAPPCGVGDGDLDTNCTPTVRVQSSRGVQLDGVRVDHGKSYVVYVWGTDGFKFTNSTISDAGMIGLYLGNYDWEPSSNAVVSNSSITRSRANGLVVEGVNGADIENNTFSQNHYWGLWPTANTPPSNGLPSNGGEVYIAEGNNITFAHNTISDGACQNCWIPYIWGTEIGAGDLNHQRTLNSLSITDNIYRDIYGFATYLNQGVILGNNVDVTGNTIQRVNNPTNLSNTIFFGNTILEPKQVITAFDPMNLTPNVPCGSLAPGASLKPGQSIKSCNGRYSLVFQSDGNVVLYNDAVARWATNTFGKPAALFVIQADGNLVLYDSNNSPLWASSQNGGTINKQGKLLVQDDGTLVIYAIADNSVMWASNGY